MRQIVPSKLSAGMRLYKYELVTLIGQGSFGEVWLARDWALQREFAVKVLKPGLSVDERLREAQIGNQLTDNNLVHIHQADVITLGGGEVVVLAMDYHPKGSIENLANSAGFCLYRRSYKSLATFFRALTICMRATSSITTSSPQTS